MNKGFFNDKESSIIRGDETIKSTIKNSVVFNCAKCGLSLSCKSPKMKISGNGKLNILICGEFLGQTDDEKGIHFAGSSGQILRTIVKELDYDLDKDFFITTACRCKPPNNSIPTAIQISSCRKYLLRDIEELKPKVIIPLGKIAVEGLIGHRLQGRISGCSMTDWANTFIPDQELKCYICPSWSPSSILRQSKNGDIEDIVLRNQIKNTIKKAIALSTSSFFKYDYLSDCFPIYKIEEAIKVIEDFSKKDVISFDYETTGLKPYRDGQKIYSVSISDGLFGISFPYFNDKIFRRKWLQLLSSKVKKICHNGKFENMWTAIRGGFNDTEGLEINNFEWDTMLAAHSLYNNKKTNLKFHSYIHLGILGYDTEIDPFLEPLSKEKDIYGDNAFNQIEKAPLEKLLKYNAMDSLLTFKLYEIQKSKLDSTLIEGVKFFTKGSMTLSNIEQNGISFNNQDALVLEKELKDKLNEIEKRVLCSKELKKWNKKELFRISAPQDITHLLFDILKYECKETTNTGKPKSDIESLKNYKLPIVQDCLEWRKWQKVYNTYIKSLTRENTNGIIHAFYHLHLVDSFRSSASNPNMQNLPKHDEEVYKMLRKLIVPRKGYKIGEYDYGSMEVRCIACYNKDPNLIAYINNPNTDMHRDMAGMIFLKDKKDISSDERYVAKNSFVFPTFYGSYYKNTSTQLWENCSKETKIHLKEKGLKKLDDFITHVQNIEKVFWRDMFPIGYDWMQKTIKDFNKNGYMDSFTGFRYWGPLSNNQIINFRIQGSGFHCLLWTLNKLKKEFEKREYKSKLIGEIHDSMILDIWPEEEKEIDHLIWNIGTQKIREYWDWIIVPLIIEKSISNIDGNWSELSKGVILKGE